MVVNIAFKTENQIWAELIDMLKQALRYRNITGFEVRQGNQKTKVTPASPRLTLHKVSAVNRGFSYRYDKVRDDTGTLEHTEAYLQEITFQVTALKLRSNSDTIETHTAGDAANAVKDYLNSIDGIKAMQALGYGLLPPKMYRAPTFVNDTEDFEYAPNIDFTVIVKQAFSRKQAAITGTEFTLIRV